MKRAQQAQVLRVSSPNDPRLRAYKDSLDTFKERQEDLARFNDTKRVWDLTHKGYKLVQDTTPYKDFYGKDRLGYSFTVGDPQNPDATNAAVEGGNILSPTNKIPKRTVIYDPRPEQPVIERMSPRQAMPPEIVAPAMRPMPQMVPVEQVAPLMEEAPVVPQEAAPAVVRRGPKAIMPTRQGGWSNQPLLMRMFPKLYAR